MSVKEVVPFLAVASMPRSLAFYAEGLRFEIEDEWRPEGEIRWCMLRRGGARLMLQQDQASTGKGVVLCLMCDDAVALYREFQGRGVEVREPYVGNGLWVTSVADPDGHRLDFESPADVPEETRLSEP